MLRFKTFLREFKMKNPFNPLKITDLRKDENRVLMFIKKIKEKENYKNPVNVEYISLNNTDYLFNPENNYVYDFNTYKKIGKLDNDLNIIKRSKIKINKS